MFFHKAFFWALELLDHRKLWTLVFSDNFSFEKKFFVLIFCPNNQLINFIQIIRTGILDKFRCYSIYALMHAL